MKGKKSGNQIFSVEKKKLKILRRAGWILKRRSKIWVEGASFVNTRLALFTSSRVDKFLVF